MIAEHDLPAMSLHPSSTAYIEPLATQKSYSACKLVLDVAIAAALLLVLWPLIVVLMILVKLTSRGPAIYSQTRIGRHDRAFVIYKLRTMQNDCERYTGAQWASDRDPRVTQVGRVLRRTHLDELPQLWNVLRGEMSLVGPRPERPEFVGQLERAIPEYRERLEVRPGLTGLAQVQLPPDVDLASVRRKIVCDLWYIRNMSLWLDAKILVGTAFKIAHMPFGVICRVLLLPSIADDKAVIESRVGLAGLTSGTATELSDHAGVMPL